MEREHVDRTLILAFCAVVLSFVTATWVSERRTRIVERDALSIQQNAAPSIRRLATARGELRRLQLLVHRALDHDTKPPRITEIDASRELLDQEIDAYQNLPTYPGEQSAWQRAKVALDRVDTDLSSITSALERDDLSAAKAVERHLDSSSEDAALALSRDIDVNVGAAARLAAAIEKSRLQGVVWAAILDGAGVLLAIGAAILALRVSRAHSRAVQALRDFAERKAEELDQFAERMAHDVRSPLAVVGISLSMAERYGGDEPRFRRAIKRAGGAFRQATSIVEALFDFVRAGAKPDPNARASASDAAEGVAVSMCTQAEQVGADLVVRAFSRAIVPCPAGLIESAIGNLVGNAIVHVEGRAKRLVAIETADQGSHVKVTVSDTGPGLPTDKDPNAFFQPYVRGKNARGRGLGLGLATVKKVVETYGGQVGVNSTPEGCAFWFTLPIAATPFDPAHPSA
jgi:signal transduction histidine kinase